MSNTKDNKVILKIRAGSHLYGLNTENSDLDYIGVYLHNKNELFGLDNSEVIEENVTSKKEDGRNGSDAVDCKYYEIRKFCRMALGANPTILELLFADEDNIIEITEEGRKLLAMRDLFLSTKIKHSFLGYAHSQKMKSQVKSRHLRELVEARSQLSKWDTSLGSKMLYQFISDDKKHLIYDTAKSNKVEIKTDENYPDYIQIADLRFNNRKLKDVINSINSRIDRASHRSDGMLEHGLDYKFISHTVRLLYEGIELLETGDLKFPLKEKELIKDIKLGKYKPTEVMDIIDGLEPLVEKANSSTKLKKYPNYNEVNKRIIDMYYGQYVSGDNEKH